MNSRIFSVVLQQQIERFGYPPTFGSSAYTTHFVWNCRDLGEHWGRDGKDYMDRCMATLREFLFSDNSHANVADLTFTRSAMSVLSFRLVKHYENEIWCQFVPFPGFTSPPFCSTPFPVRIRVAERRQGLQPEWVVHEYWAFVPLEKRGEADKYVEEKFLLPVRELMENPEYRESAKLILAGTNAVCLA
ncbi:MAG: hypothetical protein UX89_C0003G0052 [Parcubacteria group bacterium GW2011_GWA2_47_16]|nr:MAG: hypothetical protein UX89_C0003G0052 [Parcubacteria group bacterium GW2011_GWA2_47_16]